MCEHCDECAGILPVSLRFDPDAYRQASALVSAFSFGDAATADDILDGAGRDLASAMTIMLYAALLRFAELTGSTFADEVEELGFASLQAAAEEERGL